MVFQRREFHKEENCLNCGYPLIGKFCGQCGQKAFLNKESFWQLVTHFVSDYFHYDNKFLITAKTMLLKPGVATLEYNSGKRAKYLNPIALYIFVTSLYFLIVFSYSDEAVHARQNQNGHSGVETPVGDIKVQKSVMAGKRFGYLIGHERAGSLAEYDSLQKTLPLNRRDPATAAKLNRQIYLREAELGGNEEFYDKFLDTLLQQISKIFFVLLPFSAILLALVYYKRRKVFFDHLIFCLHLHAILFISLTVCRLLYIITASEKVDFIATQVAFLGILVYLYLALRKVYNDRGFKSILNLFVLIMGYMIAFVACFIITMFLILYLI